MISRILRAVTVLDRWRPLASMRIASSRLLRCTKGISSVEFVIVLPLFVLFTFGIIGFSAISYTHNNMVNAARESVRRMAVADGVDCSGPTGTCDGLPRTCGTTAVLAVALYFPAHKLIWGMRVRSMERKLKRETTAEERETARLRARLFAGVIVITFAFLFNKVLFGSN